MFENKELQKKQDAGKLGECVDFTKKVHVY